MLFYTRHSNKPFFTDYSFRELSGIKKPLRSNPQRLYKLALMQKTTDPDKSMVKHITMMNSEDTYSP